jgi:hypothetical protein
MSHLTVIPAYGRDYNSAKTVKADWNDGKDFIIADMFHPYDGKPINKQDSRGYKITIRFNQLRKVTSI